MKLKDVENTLNNCYEQINKCEQENVRLKEEKKVLEELRKLKEVETAKVQNEDIEVEAEVIDILDDDPDDEEVIEFYLTQNMNRSTRTTPVTEATNKTARPLS